MAETDAAWHLDKKVPIALIVTIAVQTGAIIWWAATASARLDQLERQVNTAAPQAERIIRLETKMDGIADAISDLKGLLRRAN